MEARSAQRVWTIYDRAGGKTDVPKWALWPDNLPKNAGGIEVVPASRLEITDEMVERAAKELWKGFEGGDNSWEDVMTRPRWHELYLPIARVTLSAALREEGDG
jgi:hypothetical protein